MFYLTKPFREDNLLQIVDSAVHNYLVQNELSNAVSEISVPYQGLKQIKFKTIDEARSVSIQLSNMCPSPQRVVVGLVELLINAVEHGNLDIGFKNASNTPQICAIEIAHSE